MHLIILSGKILSNSLLNKPMRKRVCVYICIVMPKVIRQCVCKTQKFKAKKRRPQFSSLVVVDHEIIPSPSLSFVLIWFYRFLHAAIGTCSFSRISQCIKLTYVCLHELIRDDILVYLQTI